MLKATDGLMTADGERLVELQGFLIENEVLLSDCDSMGDHKKIKVKVTPSMIKFWLEENQDEIDEIEYRDELGFYNDDDF